MPAKCIADCLTADATYRFAGVTAGSACHCFADMPHKGPVLPDGNSRILRLYVFGPSGFWTMAPLRYAAKFDPFLSLDCARVEGVGAQSKDQILPSGNLAPGHHHQLTGMRGGGPSPCLGRPLAARATRRNLG